MSDLDNMHTYTVEGLQNDAWSISDAHGFHDNRHDGQEYDTLKLMLAVGEFAEAHEEIRKGRKPDEIYYVCKSCGTEVSYAFMHDSLGAGDLVYSPTLEHGSGGGFVCEKPDFKPEGVPIEVADAVIRAADYAQIRKFSLSLAILIKSRYNETREYMHGKTM